MTAIAKTLLATHDPATVLQTERAIPYVQDTSVPDNAVFELKMSLPATDYPLFGVFKVKLDWPVSLQGGFGKTCWGARMNVAGEVDDADPGSAYLTITNDEFAAGKIMGADFGIDFRLRAWKIHHHLFKRHTWDELFDKRTGPYRLDLLTTLYTIVQAAIQLGDVIPFGDIIGALLPQNVDLSGFFDKQSGIVGNGGALTVSPKVVGDIDLVHLAEMSGVDIISLVFLAFPPAEIPVQGCARLAELGLNLLSFVTPTIAFGPSFGFGSPVDISITDFSVADTVYDVSHVELTSPARLHGTASPAPAPPLGDLTGRDLSINFHAVPKDAVYLGIFAQITWLKIISKEARKIWDVYEEAGITAFNDDPVDTTFGNDIGATDLDGSYIF